MDASLQSVTDNCLILMHNFVALPKSKINNDLLIKIFIRSALKVPSTSRMQQYFTDHVMKKSAIAECKAKTVREWTKGNNGFLSWFFNKTTSEYRPVTMGDF